MDTPGKMCDICKIILLMEENNAGYTECFCVFRHDFTFMCFNIIR